MSPDRLLSLAAGVCPETGPADFVAACAAAGWNACGIWFDADDLDRNGVCRGSPPTRRHRADRPRHGADLRDARRRSRRSRHRGGRDGRRPNLLVVSRGVDDARFTDRFGELCDIAARARHRLQPRVHGLHVDPATSRRRLAVLDAVDRPNASVLIDNLHLARTGGIGRRRGRRRYRTRLAYVQLCDAPAAAPDTPRRRGARRPPHAGRGRTPGHANSSTRSPRTPHSRSRSAPPTSARPFPIPPTAPATCSSTTHTFLQR